MRRNGLFVALALLVAFVGGPVSAQTTSTTTSTSATSTSTSTATSTSATASTTTTSTATDPACSVTECPPRPPDAFVGGSTGEIQADQSSYCWSASRAPGSVGLCADFLYQEPRQALAVEEGETLRVRFAIGSAPLSVAIRPVIGSDGRTGDPIPVTVGNPASFRAALPAGPHVLVIFATWPQGDSSYLVKLDVTARPTTPVAPGPGAPGRPLFTG